MMIKRKVDKFWFPWWPEKWLWGTIRIECTPAERGIWVDLLSLASKDDGHIRANEEIAYPLKQLAGMLILPEKELSDAIDKFIKLGKLIKTRTGTIYVAKWDKYQFSERHKRRMEEGESEEIDIFSKNTIKCPSNFSDMATKKGFVKVSRLIAAIILERSLTPEEEVHHRNGEEKDNRIENLMLFANHADHGKHEYGYTIRPLWDGSKMQMSEKTAAIAKIKATIINNSTLNQNTLNNNKIKESKPSYLGKDPNEIDIKLTQLLIDLMLQNDPKSHIIKSLTIKGQEDWINQCRLLREKDERDEREIEIIIRWSQDDSFWKANILSMPKLREKFDQLWLKAKKEKFAGIKEWLNEP